MMSSQSYEKINVKRVWSSGKDVKMLEFVSKDGSSNWPSIPKKTGIKRCGKSCRIRWTNYSKPNLKHDKFTTQEEDLIIKLHAAIGSRWSIIAQQLPGRTDNDVKNYWNTKLKKKLSQMGIDPVTHKPFSKLIADYGNIWGFQNPSTQIRPINEDFNDTMILKLEPHQTFTQNDQLKQPQKFSPKIETENNILFDRSHNNNDNISMELTQVETISIVTNASNYIDLESETIVTSVFGEGGLSKTLAPSTSICSSPTQEVLPMTFSWNDFLLEDVYPQPTNKEEQEIIMVSNDLVIQIENATKQSWNKKEIKSQQASSNEFQFASPSNLSFVEAMLDQENEMFMSFPHLMEEPSNLS